MTIPLLKALPELKRKEKAAAWQRNWRKKNPEEAKKIDALKRIKNRHKKAEYSKVYYSKTKIHPEYLEYRKQISNKYYVNNKLKAKARGIVSKSVLRGKIIKPKYCSGCLKEKIVLQGHHEDYSKPLEVIWLCPPCHTIVENFKKAAHLWIKRKDVR